MRSSGSSFGSASSDSGIKDDGRYVRTTRIYYSAATLQKTYGTEQEKKLAKEESF